MSQPLTLKSFDEFEYPLTDFITLLQEQLAQIPERDWEAVSVRFEDGRLEILLHPESDGETEASVALAWKAYWRLSKSRV